MGSSIDKFINRNFCKGQFRALMVGPHGSGKTSILYLLKLGQIVTTIDTIGFNVESIKYKKQQFTIWDIGGNDTVRHLWRHYYHNARAIIYVVDSTDRQNIQVAREELHQLIAEEQLKDTFILILANKKDRAVMTLSEMSEKLGLHNIRGKRWHFQGTSVMTGQGIQESFDWFIKQMKLKR